MTLQKLDIAIPPESIYCTMALASMFSFSGTLGDVGAQVDMPGWLQKDVEGKRLIKKFCEPQKITKANPHRWRDHNTDPEDWRLFLGYNVQDVRSETALKKRLLSFGTPPAWQWTLYHCDQKINARGLPVNRRFVEQAIEMVERRKWELREQLEDLTGLRNVNSGAQLIPWLQAHGYRWADLQKNTVVRALEEHGEMVEGVWIEGPHPMDERAAAALRIRQQLSRTSVSKYPAIMRRISEDDRLRFCFQYAGAARTNRWSGRGPQPQNLVRPPKMLEDEHVYEEAVKTIEEGDYEGLKLLGGEPMNALAGLVRASFCAGPDKELKVCDIKSVESVGVGFVAQCERMLRVFREGKDAYKDFAQFLYKVTYDYVTSEMRSKSKPATLGNGYGLSGGVILPDGKMTGLLGYAAGMGIKLTPEEAAFQVALWRKTYPEVPETWYSIERQMLATIEDRKTRTVNGLLTFRLEGQFLTMELPTGRKIYYHKPRIERRVYQSTKKKGETYTRRVMSCMGFVKNKGKFWSRIDMGGHLVFENAIQGMCRDIHGWGMIEADQDGFNLVGMVHDELIAEQDEGDNYHNHERLRECVIAPMPWPKLATMPLDASAFSTRSYRKD
jgi:DNA polymerase